LNPIAKLRHSIHQDGLGATAKRVAEAIAWRTAPIWQWPGNQIRKVRHLADAEFDRQFGVDTGGHVGIRNLDISAAQKEAAIYYEPTPAAALRAMLKVLPLAHEDFTFIDYGSGKGRVLLLASEYPFKRIIGVEISRQLNDVALRNLATWKNPSQRCFQLESNCMDAREFVLPEGPLVIFFFTPFRPPISNQVIDRIAKSYAANPRPIRIVYYGSSRDFRGVLATLNFAKTEIYSARPISALGNYRGLLYSSER
jgi:hypothetical protein